MQFIARQPIFDATRTLQGYELLFRNSARNRFSGGDPEFASKKVIDTAVMVGLDLLSEGQSLLLNCTHDLVVDGYPTLFPPDLTVIEVLESVEPDASLVAALQELKAAGYRIALDDYVDQPRFAPLVELAAIIKVDFRATPVELRRRMVDRYGKDGRQLLAEKVETDEDFAAAADMGYSLFQGYFFCRPNMMTARKLPVLPDTRFRVERALAASRLDLIEIEQLVKSEPALCYRLLRYLASPGFYLQTEIRSILQALALLGEEELRRWLLLISAVITADAEPNPLLVSTALARARFAELLAPYTGMPAPALFLLGLFSRMDAIANRPLPQILDEVVLPVEVRQALREQKNQLWRCHQIVVAYESGDWALCEELRRQRGVPASALRETYVEALRWANRVTNAGPRDSARPLDNWPAERTRSISRILPAATTLGNRARYLSR